jgi:hypothetical protein
MPCSDHSHELIVMMNNVMLPMASQCLVLTWEPLNADVCADEEVEHHVLEEPGLQSDPLPHDHPHRPLLRHHVPPEGPPSQVRYGTLPMILTVQSMNCTVISLRCLLNVDTRFCCPQTLFSLALHCEMDVSVQGMSKSVSNTPTCLVQSPSSGMQPCVQQ